MTDPTVTPMFGVPVNQTPWPSQPVQRKEEPKKHGTVDNILGFLGDFLTSRLHMGTPYRDARQAEKLNAARLADMQDPSQMFAQTGNIDPALAARLQGQAVDDKRYADSAADRAAYQRQLAEIRQDAETDRKRRIVSNFAAGLVARGNDVEGAKTYTDLLPKYRERYGEAAADLPDTYDPLILSSLSDSFVPAATQRAQKLQENRDKTNDENTDQRFGETVRQNGIKNAQTDRKIGIAASKAAAGPSRKSSESDIVAGLIDRRAAGGKLSAGELARIKKFEGGYSGSRRRAPPTTATADAIKKKYGL